MAGTITVDISGPTLYRTGTINGLLRTVGDRPWSVEWTSDAAVADAGRASVGTITAVPVPDMMSTGIPRYLCYGPTGGLFFVTDGDRGDITLRITGTFESFVPVSRITAVYVDGGNA